MQLPDDVEERHARKQLVGDFMPVGMATTFVFATEIVEPDAHVAVGISQDGSAAGLQAIARSPISFDPIARLEQHQIGDDLPALLPDKVSAVTSAQIATVDALIRMNEGLEIEVVYGSQRRHSNISLIGRFAFDSGPIHQ